MKIIKFTVPITDDGSVVVQQDALPFFYNYLHRHEEPQVTLIIKGAGTLIAGNYTQSFKAGDIFIMGENQPHIFKSDPEYFVKPIPDSVQAIHIFIDPVHRLKGLFDLPEMTSVRRFLEQTRDGLQMPDSYTFQASRFIKTIATSNGLERLTAFMHLMAFCAESVSGWKSLSNGFSASTFSDKEGMRMNDIFHFTMEHFHEDISLQQVADISHLTIHAFCKYFKKHTRKTYVEFLNEIRINEACKRILTNQFDSISSIAYSTGFNNTITFNRVFKRIVGMSPTAYIQHYRKK